MKQVDRQVMLPDQQTGDKLIPFQSSQSLSSQQVSKLVAPLVGKDNRYVPPLDLADIDENPIEAQRILSTYNTRLQDSIKSGKPLPNPFSSVKEQWLTPPLSTSLRIIGNKKDNTKEVIVDTIRGIAGVPSRAEVQSGVISRTSLADGMFTAEQGKEAYKDKEIDL